MEKKLSVMIVIGLCTAVAGCAVGPTLPLKHVLPTVGNFATINAPDLDTTVTAELGQPLIARSKTLTTPSVRLRQGVTIPTQNRGINFLVEIPSGILKKYGENPEGEFYKADGMASTFTVLGTTSRVPQNGGVFVPRKQLTPVIAYWLASDMHNTALTSYASGAVLERSADVIESSAENFRRELLYTGISKNVISIVYREYANDMVRPAYSQDLKYDLGEGKTIGFKGARFEVIQATNLGITYRVKKHLD